MLNLPKRKAAAALALAEAGEGELVVGPSTWDDPDSYGMYVEAVVHVSIFQINQYMREQDAEAAEARRDADRDDALCDRKVVLDELPAEAQKDGLYD